jgi:flagellar hook-associated protein 3 FlgL
MRVTNLIIQGNALTAVRARLDALERAQAEVVDGRKVRTVSDDPRVAGDILRLTSTIRDNEQFRRNGLFASTRLASEDVVLGSIHDMLSEAKSVALAGASADPADPTRQSALAEVNALIDQVIGLSNTKVGNEYIFGGGITDVAPFKPDGSYVGDTTIRRAEIEDGVLIDTNHTGDQILSKVITELQALATELQSGTPASIQGAIAGVSAADQVVLTGQGEIAVRSRQIQDTAQRLGSQAAKLLDRLQALRDADPTESATKLLAAQNALERAYAAIGRVMGTSFLDQVP